MRRHSKLSKWNIFFQVGGFPLCIYVYMCVTFYVGIKDSKVLTCIFVLFQKCFVWIYYTCSHMFPYSAMGGQNALLNPLTQPSLLFTMASARTTSPMVATMLSRRPGDAHCGSHPASRYEFTQPWISWPSLQSIHPKSEKVYTNMNTTQAWHWRGFWVEFDP